MDCSAHNSVLSVKAVMVIVYSVAASRSERIACVSVVSPTADVPFCHSTRNTKDHMSGVDGRSHDRVTLGGIRLTVVMFSGGPGQSIHMIGWHGKHRGNYAICESCHKIIFT